MIEMTQRYRECDQLIGKFVSDKKYGPAKIIAVEGDQCKVEYFISPWNRKAVVKNLGNAALLRLYEQTRVYVERDGLWQMGRITLAHSRDDNGYDYDVQFPNKVLRRFPEEEIYCRCWLPHDDPTTTLALGGMETQFWHERRQRFTRTLMNQRTACRGLAALLSSLIEFVPHQIDVVRRVLEDPLQRYLLADEVGMGKTIEAGLVIRQFLLSHLTGDVWVIAPAPLVKQWEQELENKFLTYEFPDRVYVRSTDDLDGISPDDSAALLIVDEAHHLVADAIPAPLERIALATPRLLLLSATPSLGKADVLLRLLRLIDPDCYANVSPHELSTRIEKREEFGIFLRGLRGDANPAILRQRLRRLPELFATDPEALSLGEQVTSALADNDIEGLRRSINALRGHVADVHRLHHRLIRTRRRDAADWVFRPRGPAVPSIGDPDLGHVRMTWISDSRNESVFDLFEQWRVQMASRFSATSPLRKELAGWVVRLFEAMGCGIDCLPDALDLVPGQFLDADLRQEFAAVILQSNDEKTRSIQLAAEVQRHLAALLQGNPAKVSRIAVFGSDLRDLKACSTALKSLIGTEKVLLASEIIDEDDQNIATRFESDSKAQVLVCSRHEEEGLNLHFVDAIIHLDLPFSPSRIEQRIGRLDRFGRKINRLEQRVVFPSVDEESSIWEAWFDVLAQAFHIFNEPVADVQFSLESIANELAEILLDQGARGLRNAIAAIRDQLAKERERLDNQYALDQVLQEEGAANGFFQALDDLEADEQEIAHATKGWITDALQLSCKGDPLRIFHFEWDQDRTLLPVWPWARLFQPGLIGNHTFLRSYALRTTQESPPQLLRIGSLLIRAVEREYRWDDRGTAFSTWRRTLEPSDPEYLAFKLSYVVETRLPEDLSEDEKTSLRVRLDGYLPPWTDVIYVDAELNIVDDDGRLALLERPYETQQAGGQDFNLGSRQEALFGLIDRSRFENLCHAIRSTSESWLCAQDRFKDTVSKAHERSLMDIEHRNRRLNQRRQTLANAGELEDSGLGREIDLNQKILETLSKPLVRLDAIGAIVLSGRSPEEFVEGEF